MAKVHPILELSKVNYSAKSAGITLEILKDVNFSIDKGASLAVTGRSGSGKTTLLNIMAGLILPASGSVKYEGEDISSLDEDARARLRAKKVGFIFQSFHLLPNLTALENIMLPLEINRQSNAHERAHRWLERVGLEARSHHFPSQLSGGEQQRVGIARAFAINPALLFADEPTGNLDSYNASHVSDLLFQLNETEKTTLIIVTHDEVLAHRASLHWPLVDGALVC